ncbi:MAG TPA: acyl-CoA thioesterase [Mesorhizobium sp.]|jgi:acyl-CoA thioesterase FadM|nr:acyl-CoA thioesterase [Mesorhizobium sp.]
MYVWTRFAYMLATSRGRGAYRPGEESRLDFRCLPNDIDFNRHLNNARYFMLADLGRIDLFARLGVLREGRKRGWAPMLGGVQAAFTREIRLWEPFALFSSVETWEGATALGRHRFVRRNGEVAATILTTAGIYNRRERKFLAVEELLDVLGIEASPRPFSDEEADFVRSHGNLRRLAKGG